MSEWKALSSITSKIGSGSTPRGGNSVYSDSGISFIRSQNVLDMDFSIENLAFINDNQAEKLNNVIVEKNDILLNITGDSIARCTVVPEEILPARVNQHVSIIRCKNTEESKYVMYYLQYMKKYLLQISKVGGTRNALTKEAIGKLPIKISDDCNKISKILDNIDQKIQINNQINQELEAMAKTLYDYWFVQFDFPDQNGKPYKSLGGKMVYHPELKREIPEGWGVEKLKYFLTIKNGRDHKHLQDGKFAVYGSGGIMRTVADYLYSGESILFPRKGTLNNVMYVNEEFWTVDTMFYSEVNKNNSALYVFYSVKDIDFNKLNTGTGVPSMTSSILYDLNIIVPEENILEKFNTIVKQNYETIKLNNIQNQELNQLRDWLLPMLMNGQIKVE